MKGLCEIVTCQICNQEMSFGRIKRHIKAKHPETPIDQYLKKYWSTLPLHQPCEVCGDNIVYKYKTCSKECHSSLQSNILKGIPKPEGFMSKEHRLKLSISHIGKIHTPETRQKISNSSMGISRNKNKPSPMLGRSQSEHQKQSASNSMLYHYSQGNEPWTKNNPHTPETIEKIFSKKPMNKLEKYVSDILEKNNIPYQYQFFLKTKDGVCKSYDFRIKDTNILIEIDGDYWHGGPGLDKHFFKLDEVKNNDIQKDKMAEELGYKLIRIWESNIYNEPCIIMDKINSIS